MQGILARFFLWAWRRLLRMTGGFGLFTILVLQLTLYFVSAGMEDVVSGLADAQRRLFFVSLLGILIGRAVGARRNGWAWMLVWMVLGLPLVFLQMTSLWSELLLAARLGFVRGFELLAAVLQRTEPVLVPPDGPLRLAWSAFSARAWLEVVELRAWGVDLFQGSPAFRAGAVKLVWGVLLYEFAVWAGTVMRRTDNALAALLPAGALLGGILAYARAERLGMLVLFLMGVLVLYAAATQKRNEQRWQERRLDYPHDMRLDFSLSSSMLIGAILLAAFIVPQVNVRSIFRSILGLDRPAPSSTTDNGDLAESLGIQRPTQPPPFFSFFEDGGLPRDHLLGSGPELAFEEVLHIRIIGPGLGEGARYYWRGLTYDAYTGRGWRTELTEEVRYGRGREVPLPELTYVQPLRQEVQVVGRAGDVAFAAGDILTTNRVFEVAWRVPLVTAFDPFGVRTGVNDYQVDSRVPLRLDNLLRTAGSEYPNWVADRYLPLPGSLPQRVQDLAVEVTRGAGNPYDRAIALEGYLRGFQYNLSLPPPPVDRDLVDYFLFDLQQGYCDYYASAMVVMARSLGIPARLAVGYAEGKFDPESGEYVVVALDAHSWPELYFPDFGWVPFEPTAGIAPIDRSAPIGQPAVPGGTPLPPLGETAPLFVQAGRWVVWAVALALAGLLLWGVVDAIWLLRLPAEDLYRRMFSRLYGYRRALALPAPERATPNELTTALAKRLSPQFGQSRVLGWFPGAAEDLHLLAASYNRIQYAPRKPDGATMQRDITLWRRLRVKIWLAARLSVSDKMGPEEI